MNRKLNQYNYVVFYFNEPDHPITIPFSFNTDITLYDHTYKERIFEICNILTSNKKEMNIRELSKLTKFTNNEGYLQKWLSHLVDLRIVNKRKSKFSMYSLNKQIKDIKFLNL